jgi:RNA polymerase sigma factor (TIGR02999 family)
VFLGASVVNQSGSSVYSVAMSDVTQILSAIEHGDSGAAERLLPLVYDELRRLAAEELRGDGAGLSLQPTALVHEAYLRLVDQNSDPHWNHRGHFYAAAAQAMRRILVESARRRQARKRGGDWEQVPLEEGQLAAPQSHPDVLALDEALTQLAKSRPRIAELVSLRYFAGLSMEQAAKAQKISLRTAERDWTFARAWLLAALSDDD